MTRRVTALLALGLDRSLDAQLDTFVTLFEKWNAKINLSAARDRAELDLHVIDSLQVVPHLTSTSDGQIERVIDVGSGGGFPVVIAAICLPSITFTALEPVHKKHAFLRTAARELKLGNLEAFARRVEDHEPRDYDVATSRATFDLNEWLATGLSLVRPGGFAIGFEAIERSDLSMPITRHSYVFDDRSRAIVVARRPV